MPDDFFQDFARGVTFDEDFDADLLEAHFGWLHLGAAGTPGCRVADVAFKEDADREAARNFISVVD